MRSVDANVILRVMLLDHPGQQRLAEEVLSGTCLILPTVLLEVVWTAHRQERLPRDRIARQLVELMNLPNLQFADRDGVAWAIERFANGADFADMLHVALSESADSFVTFDAAIAAHARNSVIPVETLVA